jgi:hypothetical protein
MPLATGRRIPGGFGEAAYLAELERHGLVVVATARPKLAVLTTMVGDLIGVARKRTVATSE